LALKNITAGNATSLRDALASAAYDILAPAAHALAQPEKTTPPNGGENCAVHVPLDLAHPETELLLGLVGARAHVLGVQEATHM